MRAIYPGHLYELDHLDGGAKSQLQFVSRAPLHPPIEGVINQEVLRALIDRVQVLDAEVPWIGNQQILHHLRMALALHEARAMLRHVEKGEIRPERVIIGTDGHFVLTEVAAPGIDARSAETSGSARQGESPVTEGQAPSDPAARALPLTSPEDR